MSADNSGEKGFAKILSKRMGRAREKVLQNIGKKDKTTDNEFDHLVELFNEQQTVATHLMKEYKNYLSQVKAMSAASQSMYHAIQDAYESSWRNSERFIPESEQLILLREDYSLKLNEIVLTPLANYANQFRDFKLKIAKRSRKMTDFDSARHNMESLENAKKRDESKISKAQEELTAAKSIYESIHNELCQELPVLYKSRVPSLCSFFRALFETEAKFMTETAKVKNELTELVKMEIGSETLAQHQSSPAHHNTITPPRPPVLQRTIDRPRVASEADNQQHGYITLISGSERIDSDNSDYEDSRTDERESVIPTYATVGATARTTSQSSSDIRTSSEKDLHQADRTKASSLSNGSVDSVPKTLKRHSDGHIESPLVSSEGSLDTKELKLENHGEAREKMHEELKTEAHEEPKRTEEEELVGKKEEHSEKKIKEEALEKAHKGESDSSDEEEVKAATAPKIVASHNFLFRVVAIHTYKAEDEDEMSFEKGEIIDVLPPSEDNSEEKDEGWMVGVKHSTGEKGLFPLNFTEKA